MKSDDPFLSKSHIDYRFGLAVCVLLNDNIANSKGEIAEELGVKPAKFSEILNGRMHVGADMLAMLADSYLVNPDWLLTGRGENMFRDSSILPIRLEDGRIQEAHPYTTENEDEVYNARLEKAEAEEKKEAEEKSAPILLNLLAKKDALLISQAEEIGRLKERIAQLEQEKNVHAAPHQTVPRELSASPVDP